eukprot:362776-Chlamydomonas_euryale.AAC.2
MSGAFLCLPATIMRTLALTAAHNRCCPYSSAQTLLPLRQRTNVVALTAAHNPLLPLQQRTHRCCPVS